MKQQYPALKVGYWLVKEPGAFFTLMDVRSKDVVFSFGAECELSVKELVDIGYVFKKHIGTPADGITK